MLARPRSSFPLEAGPLPVAYQAGVDSVWASLQTPPRLDADDGLAAWVPASLGEQKYLGIQVMSFAPTTMWTQRKILWGLQKGRGGPQAAEVLGDGGKGCPWLFFHLLYRDLLKPGQCTGLDRRCPYQERA